jgi:hypothetical protein
MHCRILTVAVSSVEAVAATSVHRQAQMQLAAHGAAAVDTEAVADRPPQSWAWDPRKRLLVVARRVLESPEVVREPEVIGDLNLSLCLMEVRETETETADFGEKQTSSPTATATAKQIGAGNTAASIPAAAAPATEEEREEAVAPVQANPYTTSLVPSFFEPPCTRVMYRETEKPGIADALTASEPKEKLRKRKEMQSHGRSPPCGARLFVCSISYSYCVQTSFPLLEVMIVCVGTL